MKTCISYVSGFICDTILDKKLDESSPGLKL